jgi:hypothetical protein
MSSLTLRSHESPSVVIEYGLGALFLGVGRVQSLSRLKCWTRIVSIFKYFILPIITVRILRERNEESKPVLN